MKNIQGKVGGGVVPITVRLPEKLRNEIKTKADELGRSMNTHIAMTLKEDVARLKDASA